MTWLNVEGARTASRAMVDLASMSRGQFTTVPSSLASWSELVNLRPLKAAWREAAAMTERGARRRAYSVAARVAMVVACLVRVARRWGDREERKARIAEDQYAEVADIHFGTQVSSRLQLCSMTSKGGADGLVIAYQ